MKLCTLWFRLNRDKEGKEVFELNHLEDGHCLSEKPTPKHPSHQSWARATWQKEHALLDNSGRVVRDYDGWKSARELS